MPDAKLERPGTLTMVLEQDSGKLVTRKVHQTLDIRDFADRAVYPWLVMAANPHLSAPDVTRVLVETGGPGAHRCPRWVKDRRHMVQPPGDGRPGRRPNADGKDLEASEVMKANTHLSSRGLARLLKERGISRDKDWVRRNRCA